MPSFTGMLTRRQAKELAHAVAHEVTVACYATERAADVPLGAIVRRCFERLDRDDEAKRKAVQHLLAMRIAGLRRGRNEASDA